MSNRSLADEWILFRRMRSLWLLLAAMSVLMIFAAWSGSERIAEQMVTVQEANAAEQQTLDAIKATLQRYESDGNPGPLPTVADAGAVGISVLAHYAGMQPAPLAAFSLGQSDINPYYFRVTALSRLSYLGDFEIQNPEILRLGHFDIAFVIIYLIPILILVLSYNILSSEKETGLLRLALSQPIHINAWLRAKIIWRAGFILGVLLVLGLIALVISGAPLSNPATWLQFALWFTIVALYGLFWFGLALLVNSFNRSSAQNGIILSGAWLILVILAPAMVSLFANLQYPPPSRIMLAAEMREASEEADANAAEALESFYFDHPEFGDVSADAQNQFNIQTFAKEDAIEKSVAPLIEEFAVQAAAQQNSVRQLQYVSPALLAQQSLNTISGTDYLRFTNFQDQVDAFHEDWSTFFVNRAVDGTPLTYDALESLPMFDYQEPTFGPAMGAIAASMIGLALLTFIIGAIAFARLRRFPVVGD